MLAQGGALSLFVAPGTGTAGYAEARLFRWMPGTNVWTRAAWAFTSAGPERLVVPGFLQAGQGYADGGACIYAYAARYAPARTGGLSIQRGKGGGEIALLRAAK